MTLTRHSYSKIYLHLVWSTQQRNPIIQDSFKLDLYRYIGEIAKNKNWLILAIGGISDHIHVLIKISTSDAAKDVARTLKANSSRFVRDNFDGLFSWQEGYGVFSVDEKCLSSIRDYVLNQEMRHDKQ
jgi:putative transposase